MKKKTEYEHVNNENDILTITVHISSNHCLNEYTMRNLEQHFYKDNILSNYNKIDFKKGRIVSKKK